NRGEAITIAVTPDDALHAERLVLAYRPAGASTFSKVKMQKQSDGVFEAAIPAPATAGAEVAYYIEARDLDDKLVAGPGSPIAALGISLAPGPAGEGASGVAAAADATEPAAGAGATPAPTTTAVAALAPSPPPRDRWVLALLVGSGGGWSRGTAEATG